MKEFGLVYTTMAMTDFAQVRCSNRFNLHLEFDKTTEYNNKLCIYLLVKLFQFPLIFRKVTKYLSKGRLRFHDKNPRNKNPQNKTPQNKMKNGDKGSQGSIGSVAKDSQLSHLVLHPLNHTH